MHAKGSESLTAGDGRELVHPRYAYPGTQPAALRRGTVRKIIKAFAEGGHSTHTAAGTTMWVVLAYCHQTALPYIIEVQPNRGFYIRRINDVA